MRRRVSRGILGVPRAVGISLLFGIVAAICAGLFASLMRKEALGQRIRDYGPRLHTKKSGTPTMGGVVIVILWGIALAILHSDISSNGLFIFLSGLLFGGIGLLDDLLSQIHRRSLGLLPHQKIVLSLFVTLILFFAFPFLYRVPIMIPFSSATFILPRVVFFFLFCWVFLSATNSMNLTDGLDGLAAGTSIIILAGYTILFHDHETLSTVLPLIGILVGFLWVNTYPARLFLGDIGSFALGGAIAALALATGTSLSLALLAGLLVAESASVIAQVIYFKLTGRRIFKISPFHHHFEAAEGIDYKYLLPNVEWPEPKIVTRLCIVQAILVGIGILSVYR